MKYKIDTSIKNDIITQELFKKEENIITKIRSWVLNTGSKDIRDSLIHLGWTPPPDKRDFGETEKAKSIVIVLDESDTTTPILVEIENTTGRSIRIGKRTKREDGFTYLEISIDDIKNIY